MARQREDNSSAADAFFHLIKRREIVVVHGASPVSIREKIHQK